MIPTKIINNQIQNKKQKHKQFKKDISVVKNTAKEKEVLLADIKVIEKKIQSYQQKIVGIEGQIIQSNKKIQDFDAQIQNNKNEMAIIVSVIELSSMTITNIQKKINAAEEQIQTITNNIQHIKQTIVDMQSWRDWWFDNFVILKDDHHQKESQELKLQQEINDDALKIEWAKKDDYASGLAEQQKLLEASNDTKDYLTVHVESIATSLQKNKDTIDIRTKYQTRLNQIFRWF